jgi:hypothetical protein
MKVLKILVLLGLAAGLLAQLSGPSAGTTGELMEDDTMVFDQAGFAPEVSDDEEMG